METENNFSFEGKKVTVVGGKGKMGNAFAQGLERAGATIQLIDRDTEPLGENPQTDVLLFAVNEMITLELVQKLREEVLKNIPIITTSSTNGFIAREATKYGCLVPIHALSGPNMENAVMIDCTDKGTLARSIATEIALIMKMEQECVLFTEHDIKIALEQAKFHQRVWDFVRNTTNLGAWAQQLPISQRRAAIGELRVLMRPDISAELIAAFLSRDSSNFLLKELFIFGPEDESISEGEKGQQIAFFLAEVIHNKDPDGLIRDWIRTENAKIDQGVPGGPRSFQEFLRKRD